MDYKNLASLIASIASVFLIPVIFYGYALDSVAFDHDFYNKEFSRYNVYGSLQDYDADNINNEVLDYLQAGKNHGLMENDFFNQREKEHLLDVKNLLNRAFDIYYLSIILFLMLLLSLAFLMDFNPKAMMQRFLSIMLYGSVLALTIAFLLFAVSKTDFDFAFGMLHKTFFAAGTYTFNPEFEKIVVLYPESLFSDAFAEIILRAIFPSAAIFLASSAALFYFFKGKFPKIFMLKFRRKT